MKIELAKKETVHFVGIGGIGMSGLSLIMKRKGFVFVGTNLHRVNAFFIQKKYLNKINLNLDNRNLKKYTDSNLRESRDKNNKLTYLSDKKKIKIIENCKVIDVSKKKYKAEFIKNII